MDSLLKSLAIVFTFQFWAAFRVAFGQSLGRIWATIGPALGQRWASIGPALVQHIGPALVQHWSSIGPALYMNK